MLDRLVSFFYSQHIHFPLLNYSVRNLDWLTVPCVRSKIPKFIHLVTQTIYINYLLFNFYNNMITTMHQQLHDHHGVFIQVITNFILIAFSPILYNVQQKRILNTQRNLSFVSKEISFRASVFTTAIGWISEMLVSYPHMNYRHITSQYHIFC